MQGQQEKGALYDNNGSDQNEELKFLLKKDDLLSPSPQYRRFS